MQPPIRPHVLPAPLILAVAMTLATGPLSAQEGIPVESGDGGFVSLVERAAGALSAGEELRARDLLRRAHHLVPGDPRVLLYLARTELATGDTARALAALERLADQGAHRDFSGDPVFDLLDGHPAYESALERMRANAAPVIRSDTAFELPDPDFLPEGLAYDPVDAAFYAGSLHRGTIVRIDPDGAVTEMARVAEGERALVVGLRVDPERRRLWAATLVVDSAAPRFRRGVGGRAALNAFDLETGDRVVRVAPGEPGPHLLNDLALTAGGDLYVTDSEAGVVYRLRSGADSLELVHGPRADFTYPNGIALSTDGSRVYVAHVEGVSTFSITDDEADLERVSTAPGIAAGGIDGLYACSGGLLAVQSMLGFQRVVLLGLDDTGHRITHQTPLEQRHPAHDAATTGAVADGAFHYIANSQLGRLGADQSVSPAPSIQPSVVLRVPIPPACAP